MKLKPFPSYAALDVAHCLLRYPIFLSDNVLSPTVSSYGQYLLRRQLSVSVGCSSIIWGTSKSVSAFFDAILRVVFFRSDKKMVGVATLRRVAAVKNVQPVWYGAYVKFIRKTVSRHNTGWRYAKRTITARSVSSSPEPAPRVWFWRDEPFKSVFNWLFLCAKMTFKHVGPPYQDSFAQAEQDAQTSCSAAFIIPRVESGRSENRSTAPK